MGVPETVGALPARAAGLVLAEGRQIIDPPQYSIAWAILAVLCALVILAIIITVLRVTRRVVESAAYRQRPSDVEGLKAEFIRAVNAVGDRFDAGDLDARSAHRELAAVMRLFVRRTTGFDVTSQDVTTLVADPRTQAVGSLIADLHEPEFARDSARDVAESLRRCREVIRAWS